MFFTWVALFSPTIKTCIYVYLQSVNGIKSEVGPRWFTEMVLCTYKTNYNKITPFFLLEHLSPIMSVHITVASLTQTHTCILFIFTH